LICSLAVVGTVEEVPAVNCAEIMKTVGQVSGRYWLVNRARASVPFEAYCNMTTQGRLMKIITIFTLFYSFTYFFDSFIHSFTHSCMHSFDRWLVYSFIVYSLHVWIVIGLRVPVGNRLAKICVKSFLLPRLDFDEGKKQTMNQPIVQTDRQTNKRTNE